MSEVILSATPAQVAGTPTSMLPASAPVGSVRFDDTANNWKRWSGSAWVAVGGGGGGSDPATDSANGIVTLSAASATPSAPVVLATSDSRLVLISATAGVQSGRIISITFQATTLDGVNLTKAIRFKWDGMSSTDNVTNVAATTGTLLSYNTGGAFLQTNASGTAVLALTDSAAESLTVGFGEYFGSGYVDGSPCLLGSGQITITYT